MGARTPRDTVPIILSILVPTFYAKSQLLAHTKIIRLLLYPYPTHFFNAKNTQSSNFAFLRLNL